MNDERRGGMEQARDIPVVMIGGRLGEIVGDAMG